MQALSAIGSIAAGSDRVNDQFGSERRGIETIVRVMGEHKDTADVSAVTLNFASSLSDGKNGQLFRLFLHPGVFV